MVRSSRRKECWPVSEPPHKTAGQLQRMVLGVDAQARFTDEGRDAQRDTHLLHSVQFTGCGLPQ